MADKLNKAVNKRAAKQMDELRRCSAGTDHIISGMLDVQQRVAFLDLADEASKAHPLAAEDNELERIPIVIDTVDDCDWITAIFRAKRLVTKKLSLFIHWLCMVGLHVIPE